MLLLSSSGSGPRTRSSAFLRWKLPRLREASTSSIGELALLHCDESREAVFLSFFLAVSSWLLSKNRGENGASGSEVDSDSLLSCCAGRAVGSSEGGNDGGGGGGGGGGDRKAHV